MQNGNVSIGRSIPKKINGAIMNNKARLRLAR